MYLFSFYFQPRARLNPLPDADSLHCTNNRLGFYFSQNPVSDTSGISLPNSAERNVKMIRHFDSLNITPQVAIPTDTFYTDTSNYTYYEQTFIAQGGEQYITMGNFYPIEQTLYKNLYTHEVFSTYLEDTTIYQVSYWHIDDLNLQLIPQPNQAFTHSSDTNICPGESIELFARLEVPGSYLWSTGDTTPTINVSQAGVYSVTASCPCGMEYSAEIVVEELHPLPHIEVNDTNICENIGHIQINLPPAVEYFLNGIPQSRSISITAEGNYHLIARNECEEKDMFFHVGVIPCDLTLYIPNAFTPNDDGRNDCFHIAATNVYHFHIRIFNRWGQEIFTSSNANFCWDGTLNGNPLPQGVYTLKISYSESEIVPPKQVLRSVTLIR